MAGLRPGWAIVGELPKPEADDTPREVVRPLAEARVVLSATPRLYQSGPGRIMLTALVEGADELQRVIRRRLPGVTVQASGVEPTLLEFHEAGIDPNDWLRAPAP